MRTDIHTTTTTSTGSFARREFRGRHIAAQRPVAPSSTRRTGRFSTGMELTNTTLRTGGFADGLAVASSPTGSFADGLGVPSSRIGTFADQVGGRRVS